MTKTLSFKQPSRVDQGNPNWKGDKASKAAIHAWLTRHYGKPMQCEKCGTTTAKRYDWANISQTYIRARNDFLRLCRSCHVKMDKNWLKKDNPIYKIGNINKTPNNQCKKCNLKFWNKQLNKQYCSKTCMYERNT